MTIDVDQVITRVLEIVKTSTVAYVIILKPEADSIGLINFHKLLGYLNSMRFKLS